MLAQDRTVAKKPQLARWLLIGGGVLLLLVTGALIFLLLNWPFTRNAVADGLGQVFSSTVDIGSFRSTYFPHPGCVAEAVRFRDGRSEGNIRKLTFEASWATLLTGQKYIGRIQAEGLYVKILPRGQTSNGARPGGGTSNESKLTVGEIVANGSVLEVKREDPDKQPLRFDIHELTLRHVGKDRAIAYRAVLHNATPSGEVHSEGEIGPFRTDEHSKTPLHGSYTFDHADLGEFHMIGGILSSKGTFSGILERIEVQGPLAITGFEVKSSGHPVDLSAKFHVFVNGTNGDVRLENVESHFAGTTIDSNGDILGAPGRKGKTVAVNMEVRQGHIQDLMRLLMKSKRPPMAGEISFHAKAVVPPDGAKFLERVELTGDFGIGGASFTSQKTQKNIDVLSERARGDKNDDNDPENVISNLKGHVVLRGGVASFSNVSFRVPGAAASLGGKFNLLNEHIDLSGDLAMAAELSEATKGFKSFLLKAVDPFFKKKKAGAVVPIHIGGTYSQPSYGLSMTGKKSGK